MYSTRLYPLSQSFYLHKVAAGAHWTASAAGLAAWIVDESKNARLRSHALDDDVARHPLDTEGAR